MSQLEGDIAINRVLVILLTLVIFGGACCFDFIVYYIIVIFFVWWIVKVYEPVEHWDVVEPLLRVVKVD